MPLVRVSGALLVSVGRLGLTAFPGVPSSFQELSWRRLLVEILWVRLVLEHRSHPEWHRGDPGTGLLWPQSHLQLKVNIGFLTDPGWAEW